MGRGVIVGVEARLSVKAVNGGSPGLREGLAFPPVKAGGEGGHS